MRNFIWTNVSRVNCRKLAPHALDAVSTNNLGINSCDAGATFEWPRNAILRERTAGLCEIKPSFEPRDLDALLVPTTLAFFHPNYFVPFNFVSNGRLFFIRRYCVVPPAFTHYLLASLTKINFLQNVRERFFRN